MDKIILGSRVSLENTTSDEAFKFSWTVMEVDGRFGFSKAKGRKTFKTMNSLRQFILSYEKKGWKLTVDNSEVA